MIIWQKNANTKRKQEQSRCTLTHLKIYIPVQNVEISESFMKSGSAGVKSAKG